MDLTTTKKVKIQKKNDGWYIIKYESIGPYKDALKALDKEPDAILVLKEDIDGKENQNSKE